MADYCINLVDQDSPNCIGSLHRKVEYAFKSFQTVLGIYTVPLPRPVGPKLLKPETGL